MRRMDFVGLGFVLAFVMWGSEALAGPGGRVASAFFTTPVGKVVGILLFVVFLPFIVYVYARERWAASRVQRQLAGLSAHDPAFDWVDLRLRIKDCYLRVHDAWDLEDLSAAHGWMTHWYLQNQQLVHLDGWRRRGLVNRCHIKLVSVIRPLALLPRNPDEGYEGSMLAVSMSAVMNDYLEERESGRIVEGTKEYQDVDSIWIFRLCEGQWKLADIDDARNSHEYASGRAWGSLADSSPVTSADVVGASSEVKVRPDEALDERIG